MKIIKKKVHIILNKIPIIGILLFALLFGFSSTLYPGGSQVDANSLGFDWINNYWCNLLNKEGINGQSNPARPYSISAMIVLCLSMMVFFVQFAEVFSKNKLSKRTIQMSGILSMFFACLLFTSYHDLMSLIASFFGLFVLMGMMLEIYRSKLRFFKVSGILCALLLAINNYIYFTEQFINCLPLLQKGSMLMVLLWIIGLNFEVKRRLLAL